MLDKRLHAYRDDLADVALKGKVEAAAFVKSEAAYCWAPVTGVFKSPAVDAMQTSQLLLGEKVQIFERKGGWAWVQLSNDGYVGYVREGALSELKRDVTHHVTTPLAHLFPKADLKSTPAVNIAMNAGLSIVDQSGEFLKDAFGQFIYAAHCAPLTTLDFVSIAEQFLHTPYLWGGKTAMGIDCSGLVQVAMQAVGLSCPRDSDMQEAALGRDVTEGSLQRGDLVFWKGHVGIMQDADLLLHANAHHMKVASEPLVVVKERSATRGSHVTAVKRPQ